MFIYFFYLKFKNFVAYLLIYKYFFEYLINNSKGENMKNIRKKNKLFYMWVKIKKIYEFFSAKNIILDTIF